ncbi:hypothetical protein M413DRAFT_447950, partial [Hebeloma cylindrosporum]
MANPNIATEQLLELLLTLKKTTPAAARGILNNQPAIAYALIKLMVSIDVINIEVFQKTLAEYDPGTATPSSSTHVQRPASVQTSTPSAVPQQIMPPTAAPTPISAIPRHMQPSWYPKTATPPPAPLPSSSAPSYLGSGSLPPASSMPSSSSLASAAPTHTPTPPYGYTNGQGSSSALGGGYGAYAQQGYGAYQQPQQQPQQQQQQQQYQQYQQGGGYAGYPGYAAQPPAQAAPPAAGVAAPALPDALAGIPEEQKALIMRVLSMTTEQLNLLPPADRATYIQIRTTLGVPTA